MNERGELPPVVDRDPKQLISRQTKSEMTPNNVERLRKKIRKNGFDRNQPIEVVDVKGKLIIRDGHHRTEAAIREKLPSVPVRIYKVTLEIEDQYTVDASEA
ncbi:MAG: ParB/RepB/Spo0J family partition protein, partial [Waterburya sp.]